MRRQHAWVLIGLLLVTVIAVAGFGVALKASAQTTFSVESIGGQIGLGNADLKQVILNIIRWALGILTLTAVVFIMYGGYLWLTAAGNEQKVEKAKQVILQAVIGLVIVLLAWAIVYFVARSIAGSTSTGGNDINPPPPPCDPINQDCGVATTFDITNIASCAAVSPNADVPRSSALQLTLNANLAAGMVQQAVEDDVDDSVNPPILNINPPNLIVQECNNVACTDLSLPVPLENQRYIPGTTPTTTGTPQADWVQNGKTITFYHVATDQVAADARLFKANQKYLLTIPAKDASKALTDINDRTLQNCRRKPGGLEPNLPGCDVSATDRITWEFTTGSDVDGPALKVVRTYPSSSYITTTAIPNRTVSRASFLSIQYSTAIDFNTLTTDNFKVFKCDSVPTSGNDWHCDTVGSQVSASNYAIEPRPDGQGGILRIVQPPAGQDPFLYDSFTWYQVEVSNVRNLCGRVQDPTPYTWVFQTSDVVPGVKQVYPKSGKTDACPSTRVFIQYNTSMWNGGPTDCNLGAGSYVTSGTMTNNPGRFFQPVGGFDENDPNTCSLYEFVPTTTLLPPSTPDFEVLVQSDLVIDSNGGHLNYGTPGGIKPWTFGTATATTCTQEPVITKISPGQGPNGQCLSVIGDYFEKVNKPDTNPGGPDAGDKLELRTIGQTADTWENTYIVSNVDAGTGATALATNLSHPYTVTVDYGNPIGPLTSEPENYYLTADAGTQGPCLTKISPTNGPVGTIVTAYGKRFGLTQGQVLFSPFGPWSVGGPWTETKIDNITVTPSLPGPGLVTVVDSNLQESNELPFTVKSPGFNPGTTGTVPSIVETTTCSSTTSPSPNPRNNELQACINALPSARFNIPIDPATINPSNIVLDQCNADYTICNDVGATVVPFTNNLGFKLTPPGTPPNLSPATAYRITVRVGVTSADGVPMAAPYEWRFTTKAGTATCPITQVIIQQSDKTFSVPFALGLPTEVMDGACNTVNGSGLTYAWSNLNDQICTLQTSNTGPNNICTSPYPTINEGDTTVQVSLPSESISSNQVKITASLIACQTSAQCACNGNTTSQCIGGSCTPVITSISPDNGRIGTWTTIRGCWFGGYNSTTSKVIFTDNKEGLVPVSSAGAAICNAGNTWSNTQIIREVPKLEEPDDPTDNAVTGKVKVIRSVSASSPDATNPTFTVNANESLKLCRIDPSSGQPGLTATLYGKDLGSTQGTDTIDITDADAVPPNITPFTAVTWSNGQIGTVVPTPLGTNPLRYGLGFVRATHLGIPSNPVGFNLLDPSANGPGGTVTCAPADQCTYGDDSKCTDGTGIIGGCGFNHCCAARPIVTGTRPTDGETDVCRNTAVQVDFSQPLLSSSVNGSTVRYFDGPRVVNGKVTLRNNPTTITYEPGLLSPNLDQHLKLTTVSTSPVTVLNPSFQSATAGVIQDWNAGSNISQSPDHPSGASGVSALADCTVAGCTQSDIAQNVGVVSNAVRTYRVTGWVKVEYTANQGTSIGGLITRCDGSGAGQCTNANRTSTFDLYGDAPGLFSAPTNGWKKIDFQITNALALNIRPQLDCFARTGMKVWCDEITMTQVTEQPTLLRGTSGVLADVSGFNLNFTSSSAICNLDRVVVTPSTKVLTAAGQVFSPDPLAQGFSGRRTTPLAEVAGVYEWDWRWERVGGSDAIATVANQDAPTTTVTAGTTNGKIAARATAKVTVDANNDATVGREVYGQSQVTVEFCENPFTFTDNGNNCGAGGACQDFHFKMHYCPSAQEPLLQHQAIEGKKPGAPDPTRLKSFFLKESVSSQDVIGILVFDNPELLSPYDWFTARFPGTQPGSSTTIGGFPAVRTGTTAYIGVTDLNGTQLAGYMFVIDFNSNSASVTTKSIYNRLLSSIEFNATQLLSNENRLAIAKDTQRVQDLRSIKTLLEAYKTANGRYPDLPAGSFLTGFSTSAWPSWQRELANALGRTLPTDPDNGFSPACQAPYEAASCWYEPSKRFQCPVDSHIYSYKATSGGAGYELFAHLDYDLGGGFTNYSVSSNPCSSFGGGNTCACFNYRLPNP